MCLHVLEYVVSITDFLSSPYPYLYSPADVTDHVISHLTSCDESDRPELVAMLHKYREMLEDHNQAESLVGLGLGTYN